MCLLKPLRIADVKMPWQLVAAVCFVEGRFKNDTALRCLDVLKLANQVHRIRQLQPQTTARCGRAPGQPGVAFPSPWRSL